jgi:hypothetical protein
VAAEGHEAGLVPGHEHLERRHVAATQETDQPFVGLEAQQGRAPMQTDAA